MGGAVRKLEPPAEAVAADAHWSEKMRRLRQRKAAERTLTVWLDDDARSELAAAEKAYAAFDDKTTTDAKRASKRLSAAQEAADEAQVRITLRGLPRAAYEELMAAHPPTDEQKEDGQVYNPDTFAPALISTCSVDGMPLEDAKELLRLLSQPETGLLFTTAIAVCTVARVEID